MRHEFRTLFIERIRNKSVLAADRCHITALSLFVDHAPVTIGQQALRSLPKLLLG
jgi:hypothetical protein